jgi:hypothetical protein
MGDAIAGINNTGVQTDIGRGKREPVKTKIETPGIRRDGISDNNTDTPDTASGRTGDIARPGTTTGTGTGTEENTVVPKVVTVNVPLTPEQKEREKKDRRNALDRERRASKAGNTGGASVRGKNATPQGIDTTQINMILMTVSAIVASRPGLEIWMLRPEEIQQISTPLSNILAKSEALSGMTEHADAIALAIACGTILIPRIMLTVENKKAVNKHAQSGVKLVSEHGNNKRATVTDISKRTDAKPTATHTNDSENLLDLISVTAY